MPVLPKTSGGRAREPRVSSMTNRGSRAFWPTASIPTSLQRNLPTWKSGRMASIATPPYLKRAKSMPLSPLSWRRGTMLTVLRGTNADLIANVARLYLPADARVADVTYGRGVFWRHCQAMRATIWASDLKPIVLSKAQQDWLCPLRTIPLCADFRCLPYATASFDIVVLDPPYIHNPGKHLTDARYNNAATSRGMCHRDILLKLYYPGMKEAARILKPGGQLWVKCKDEIESSEQRWSHREMYDLTRSLG